MGLITVIHTFGADLKWHPHLHLLVTEGGLSLDGERWVTPYNLGWLMAYAGLKKMVRGREQRLHFKPLPHRRAVHQRKEVKRTSVAGTNAPDPGESRTSLRIVRDLRGEIR